MLPGQHVQQAQNSKRRNKFAIVGTVALAVVAGLFLSQSSNERLGGAALFEVTSSEKGQAFMHFLARYGKTYSSKGELAKRFGIFVKNIEAVAAHNRGNGFKKGVNQFSDMTT